MKEQVMTRVLTVALAGNPNCGKTTIFNGLTGSTAKVGNWPGVTVERKQGILREGDREISIVDLPGIYSLAAESEDEKAARDFLISGSVDVVVSILDAAHLERNLYLTASLIETGLPVVAALNMMDSAEKEGLQIDPVVLSRRLGCPVIPLSATRKESLEGFKQQLVTVLHENSAPAGGALPVRYGSEIEEVLEGWAESLEETARNLRVAPRFLALNLLEEDEYILALTGDNPGPEAVAAEREKLQSRLPESPDMIIADRRYAWIADVCRQAVKPPEEARGRTGKADAVLMHRFLGIPLFIGIMYLVFWATMAVGGSFIDFFDILFGGIFVDGLGTLLARWGTPDWLVSLIAGGVGGGIQTVATFVPIIFVMFFMLSLLEDSGYMARAAFVMDRAMKALGLPGKAFVPLLIGFGCTVPAIMAARTLESKRDRFMTIFMSPFMSCGARLPVYALFTAAFFGARSGAVVFSLYFAGILLSVLTGVLLKNTVFRGSYTSFVMELPDYHMPHLGKLTRSAWQRLKIYLFRAGKVIVLVVTVLAFFNSLGIDGSFGNEDSEESVLAVVGKSITPVFTPMGIEEDNWPATVSLFTGLFAKEAVVGTLNALYSQDAFADGEGGEEEDPWSLPAVAAEAFISIGENLSGVAGALLDPLGIGIITGDRESAREELETDDSVFSGLQANFSPVSAYAYLLFILIYFPCVAALGAAIQTTGKGYGTLLVTYLTLLAWIVATLFYQIFEGGSVLWIGTALILLLGIYGSFLVLGRRSRMDALNRN